MSFPRLIEQENLRGTFHNHTTASDGRNTLEEMADAAIELGLEYLGIADHSKSSFQANGLSAERLRAQISDIRDLNKKYEDEGVKFKIFAGNEVDYLARRQPRFRRRTSFRARLHRRQRSQRHDLTRGRND